MGQLGDLFQRHGNGLDTLWRQPEAVDKSAALTSGFNVANGSRVGFHQLCRSVAQSLGSQPQGLVLRFRRRDGQSARCLASCKAQIFYQGIDAVVCHIKHGTLTKTGRAALIDGERPVGTQGYLPRCERLFHHRGDAGQRERLLQVLCTLDGIELLAHRRFGVARHEHHFRAF